MNHNELLYERESYMSSTKNTIGGHMVGECDYSKITPRVNVDKNLDLEPFVLENVDIHVGQFEARMDDALQVLPPSLQPTIPASISIAFYRSRESAFGPYQWLSIGVGCRCGVKPHNLMLRNYCTNTDLAKHLSTYYGFEFTSADQIRVDKGYHAVESSLVVEGKTQMRMKSVKHMMLPGASAILKYPSPLHHVVYDGNQGLLRLDMGYEFQASSRGTLSLGDCDDEFFPGIGISPTHAISATYSEKVTVGIIQPRYLLDVEKLPSEGGIQKVHEL